MWLIADRNIQIVSETNMMEHTQPHRPEACTCQCAAIWKLEDSLIACLRTSEVAARQAGRVQILIADLVASFCQHEGAADELRQLGVAPTALYDEISVLTAHAAHRQDRASRIALSDPLNALLIACEESAAFVGSDAVTLKSVFATLVCNATQDPAAQIFANHATALQRMTSQDHRAAMAVSHEETGRHARARSRHVGSHQALRGRSHADRATTKVCYEQTVRTAAERLRDDTRPYDEWQRNGQSLDGGSLSRLDRQRQATHRFEREQSVHRHASERDTGSHSIRQDAVQSSRARYKRDQFDHKREHERRERRGRHGEPRTDAARPQRAHTARQSDPHNAAAVEAPAEKRFYLSLEDDLVEAPSIGPKTAARFAPFGVHTVADFLSVDIEDIAEKLDVRHITVSVLQDWQDQARLVCTVPWLRGTHAQLLVGADYRSADEVANADLGDVLAGILRFAATHQGERVLRTNPPPEREKVATWIDHAQQADLSRVA